MGIIRKMFGRYITDGKNTNTLVGLIFKVIITYVLFAIIIGIFAVISFVCGFIPIIGWVVSIICWIINILLIIGVLYSIPGHVIMFLAHYNVIK